MPPTQYRVTTLPHAFFWSSNLSATYLFNLVQLVNFKTTSKTSSPLWEIPFISQSQQLRLLPTDQIFPSSLVLSPSVTPT